MRIALAVWDTNNGVDDKSQLVGMKKKVFVTLRGRPGFGGSSERRVRNQVLQQGLNELHVRAHLFVRLPNVACVFREELKNLADDPQLAKTKSELLGRLKKRMKDTKDPWVGRTGE